MDHMMPRSTARRAPGSCRPRSCCSPRGVSIPRVAPRAVRRDEDPWEGAEAAFATAEGAAQAPAVVPLVSTAEALPHLLGLAWRAADLQRRFANGARTVV